MKETAVIYRIQNLIQHRHAVPNLIQLKHTLLKGIQLKYFSIQNLISHLTHNST
jgi:hypothetical protein